MKKFINILMLLTLLAGFTKLNVIAYEGITGMGCKLPVFEENSKKENNQKEKNLKKKEKQKDSDCQLEFENNKKAVKEKPEKK